MHEAKQGISISPTTRAVALAVVGGGSFNDDELGAELGVSRSTAARSLGILAELGAISYPTPKRGPRQDRATREIAVNASSWVWVAIGAEVAR